MATRRTSTSRKPRRYLTRRTISRLRTYFHFLDRDVLVSGLGGGAAVDLYRDDATRLDAFFGLGVVDALEAVEEKLDVPFASYSPVN